MYNQLFIQMGLTAEQASIYETLIVSGLISARSIAQKTAIKRGMVYKSLDQLIELGLVVKRDDIGKISMFFPTHPDNLRKILDKKNQDIRSTEASFDATRNKLSSEYNLISGKPNVQFFEGLDGMKRVLDDSLSAETEIYSYADLEAIQKYIPDINAEYVKKRDKFNIKKKAILLDTPFARTFLKDYYKGVTDIKLIDSKSTPFQTVIQIYDNKISYITLSEKEMIGVIIEDKHIYTMHKDLFEYNWESAKTIDQ